MRDKLNKHPCLLALFSVLFIVIAFIGSNVVAGIQDRSSGIDLMPAPHNYIRLPDVKSPSRAVDGKGEAGEMAIFNDDDMLKTRDQSGNSGYLAPTIVLIDHIEKLKAWEGTSSNVTGWSGVSGSGASYFQMEANKIYLVDPHRIANSSLGVTGYGSATTAFATGADATTFSQVTGILPLATATNHLATVGAYLISSGPTGYAVIQSGNTPLRIWAAAGLGVSDYANTIKGLYDMGKGGTRFPSVYIQTAQVVPPVLYSGISTYIAGVTDQLGTGFNAGGGISIYENEIVRLGDGKMWRLFYNTAVSAQLISEHKP